MTYLLDTNTCIRYLNGRAPNVPRRLQAVSPAEVRVCAVVKAEMYFGAMKSIDPVNALAQQRAFLDIFESLPFDDAAAEAYGRLRAELARRGTPIGPNDLMIAAIALAHDLTLVTHNTAEFSRVPGLRLDDWE
jgi:tRNA(fMet)-specific endonuclease VapC